MNRITIATSKMIEMYESDNVFIAPNLDIMALFEEGLTDEEIEERVNSEFEKGKIKNRTFKQSDFKSNFIDGLKEDYSYLKAINDQWQSLDDSIDPKLDVFIELLKSDLFRARTNELGKLVIFTESKDTLSYLTTKFQDYSDLKVLAINSENRSAKFSVIEANFDENYEKEFQNEYDIILTTDVLAEGINLHRSNVIVNYDTPWNPTRLIQRLGRINRIGSKAKFIYNYNFYPSAEGDKEINLINKSLAKLQSAHSAFGEDSKIYTLDEIVDQFKLFEEKENEELDLRTIYLDKLRDFAEKNPIEFKRIKSLSMKSRCIRSLDMSKLNSKKQHTIAFLNNGHHKNIYIHQNDVSEVIPFDKAVQIFEANITETGIDKIPEIHYDQVNAMLDQYLSDLATTEFVSDKDDKIDVRSRSALSLMESWEVNQTFDDTEVIYILSVLKKFVDRGTYPKLSTEIYNLRKLETTNVNQLEIEIQRLGLKYITSSNIEQRDAGSVSVKPAVIISETFS